MLILGLVEAALELVPEPILKNQAVITAAKARGKSPQHTILDEALHSKAIQKLPEHEKRGRPDIIHRSLLTALDSVLARENQLQIFVHTYADQLIVIHPGTRLPRRLPRFVGLMEQLLTTTQVPRSGEPLLSLHPESLEVYLQELQPSQVFLLTQDGTQMTPTAFVQTLHTETQPLVLVGGFAHGTVSPRIRDLVEQQVCLDPELLPASTVIGMIIHNLETVIGLTQKRFSQSSQSSEKTR